MDEIVARLRADATAAHAGGAFVDAEALYRRVLSLQPADWQVLANFSVLAAQTGRVALAEQLLRRAIDADAKQPMTHSNLGVVLTRLKRYEAAVASFDLALSLAPSYADAHVNRAVALGYLSRHAEALAGYDEALCLMPQSPALHCNRGVLLGQMNRYEEALQSLDTALGLDPKHAPSAVGRADVLLATRRFQEGLAAARRALALAPDLPEAHVSAGNALLELSRASEALAHFDRTLALRSNDVPALIGRAAALAALLRPQDSLDCCERALAIDPQCAPAYLGQGIALHELNRYEEALACFERAIGLDPACGLAHHNRASALMQMQRFQSALQAYDHSSALMPNEPDPLFAKGVCLLLLGRFDDGWGLYESRLSGLRSLPIRAMNSNVPRWHGEAIQDKKLLVRWEQGLGDTIQFCRYLQSLANMGASIIFEVQPALRRLLRSLPAGIRLITDAATGEGADYFCPLLSVPGIIDPRLQRLPLKVPYLAAEPERIQRWRRRLGNAGFKIGVCWQGSRRRLDVGRSFPLDILVDALADLPEVRLISLQKHDGLEQLRESCAQRMEALGEDYDAGPEAFVDAAAVIRNLDLVITSDTAIAHLAGALGCQAWVALRQVPDWRWRLTSEATAWYPTLRLFRQSSPGDWAGVFQGIRLALCQQLKDAAASRSAQALPPPQVSSHQ
jgi:tetratricopeptide (TPR) repeat protein